MRSHNLHTVRCGRHLAHVQTVFLFECKRKIVQECVQRITVEASDDIGKFIQVGRSPRASARQDFGTDIKQCLNISEDVHQRLG